MKHNLRILTAALGSFLGGATVASAVTNVFFNAYQTATIMSTNMTSTTIRSRGYLLTYSVDGWWTALPGGPPTGRFQSVLWPNGVDAQTLTADASGPLSQQVGASITIRRADGQTFDLRTFTAKILGNTAGAGASLELMPQLNGTDAFANPLTYDATGYAGQNFSYAPMLSGYDSYILSLWMDYGLTQLTVSDSSNVPEPVLQTSLTASNYVRISWPANPSDFTLLENTNFVPGTWNPVTNSTSIIGTNNQVLVPATNGTRFFQLVF